MAPICFAFQRGECTRGDGCRFSHSEDGSAPPARHTGRGLCFSFQRGVCGRGDSCRFSHEIGEPARFAGGVCYAWQRGECKRGNSCHFSHENMVPHTYQPRPRKSHLCYDFQRGECNRGDNCRFSHGEAAAPCKGREHDGHFGYIMDNEHRLETGCKECINIRELRDWAEAGELESMVAYRAWTCCWCEDGKSTHCCMNDNKKAVGNPSSSNIGFMQYGPSNISMTPMHSYQCNGSYDDTWEGNKRGWRCNCLKAKPDEVGIGDAIAGVRVYNFQTGEYGDPL